MIYFTLLLMGILLLIMGIALSLVKSLRQTIYSYRNVAKIGGILYLFVQFSVLLIDYIRRIGDDSTPSADEVYRMITDLPHGFANVAVLVVLVVCSLVFISNLALIRHEGFRITNLLGAVLGVLYIGGTVAVFGLSYYTYDLLLQNDKAGIWMAIHTFVWLCITCIIVYLECIMFGTGIMGYVAAKAVPKYDKDFIIILGCLISKQGGLLPLLKGRTNTAIHYAWQQEIATGKSVRYVPSGGQGPNEIMSEGSAIELYLLSHGAEDYEVFAEKSSRNTYENMLYSKKLIDSIMPDAKIAFATTNYHVFRSGMLARRAGFDAEGIASPTKWYFWPNGFVREFIAILKMYKKAHITFSVVCAIICAIFVIITNFEF